MYSVLLLSLFLQLSGINGQGCTPNSEQVPLKASAVRGGFNSLCVLTGDSPGKSKCWGWNHYGQLGLGDTSNRGDEPGEMSSLPFTPWNGDIRYTTGGGLYQRFAHFVNGAPQQIQGMGYGRKGALCQGNTDDQSSPVTVDVGSHVVKAVYSRGYGGCIVTDTEPEEIYCWGKNNVGQLGLGHTNDIGDEPGECGDNLVAVDLGTVPAVKQYAAAHEHQCVLFVNNKIKCWGYNAYGQLGRGDTVKYGSAPGQMGDNLPYVDTGSYVPKKLMLNAQNTCIVTTDDELVCWGQAHMGHSGWLSPDNHIGDGPNEVPNNLRPADLGTNADGTPKTVKAVIQDTGYHLCVIANTDEVFCWGHNEYGECGVDQTGDWTNGDIANEIGNNRQAVDFSIMLDAETGEAVPNADQRYAVELHGLWRGSCATLDDGSLACWGRNDHGGALGRGDSSKENTWIPRLVSYGGSLAGECANTFSVGGTATLDGATVTVNIDQHVAQAKELSGDGAWTFDSEVEENIDYTVTLSPIASHACTLGGATSGTLTAAVDDLIIDCVRNTYTLGGSSTLNGATGVVITEGSQTVTSNADGTWEFSSKLDHGYAHTVSVTSPTGYLCTLTGSFSGQMTQDVDDVAVFCDVTYSMGGATTELQGATGVVVTVDQPEDTPQSITLDADGAWTFDTKLRNGDNYQVIVTSPTDFSCTANPTSGTVTGDHQLDISCKPLYSLGGTVAMNGAAEVVLSVDVPSTQAVTITGDGSFTFPTKLVQEDQYAVSVVSSSADFVCELASNTGVIMADTTDIEVTCLSAHSLGGSATLNGATGVEVAVNQPYDTQQTVTLGADGSWTFSHELAKNDVYQVTVISPTDYECTLTDDAGTITADTSNVGVTCLRLWSLGGTATMNGATGLVVKVNQPGDTEQTKTLTADDTAWSFGKKLVDGDNYSVTKGTDPVGFSCTLGGTMADQIAADVSDITVVCEVATYALKGEGVLNGATGVVVTVDQPNDTPQSVTLDADGAFQFGTDITHADTFTVTVQDPTDYTCSVSGTSSGTMTAEVVDVLVTCQPLHSLGGTATLNGATDVELSVNVPGGGNQDIRLQDDSAWTFDTEMVHGHVYEVTVASPADFACSVAAASGTLSADTTTVGVTCLPLYSLGGSATLNGATVEITVDQPAPGQTVTLTADGAFTFDSKLVSGSAYEVTANDPAQHDCQLGGITTGGTITQDTSDLTVTCTITGYPVGGVATINGGSGVILHLVGNSDAFEVFERVDVDGNFTFDLYVPFGTDYVLTAWNPEGYECDVESFNGTVVGAIDDITVTCDDYYTAGVITGNDDEEGNETLYLVILLTLACFLVSCGIFLFVYFFQLPGKGGKLELTEAEPKGSRDSPMLCTPGLTGMTNKNTSVTQYDFEAGLPATTPSFNQMDNTNTEGLYNRGFKE